MYTNNITTTPDNHITKLLNNFQTRKTTNEHKPVSYTHLDVYKRQVLHNNDVAEDENDVRRA